MNAIPAFAERDDGNTPGIAQRLASELAGVLRVDHVPPDSHFFRELGADSLLMAHVCARIRRRGDLPVASMKDVYAHPTINRLAAALAQRAAESAARGPEAGPATPTSAREHAVCGALQALFYLGYAYLGVLASIEGYDRLVAGSSGVPGY